MATKTKKSMKKTKNSSVEKALAIEFLKSHQFSLSEVAWKVRKLSKKTGQKPNDVAKEVKKLLLEATEEAFNQDFSKEQHGH